MLRSRHSYAHKSDEALILELNHIDNRFDELREKVYQNIPSKWHGRFPLNLYRHDEKVRRRVRAVNELSKRSGPKVVQALTDAVSDTNIRVRVDALRGLMKNGKEAYSAIPALLPLLSDRNTEISFQSTTTILAIAPDDPRVQSRLKELMDMGDQEIENQSFAALLLSGPLHPEYNAELVERWTRMEDGHKLSIFHHLYLFSNAYIANKAPLISERIANPTYEEILRTALYDTDPRLIRSAISRISHTGPAAKIFFDAMRKYMNGPITFEFIENVELNTYLLKRYGLLVQVPIPKPGKTKVRRKKDLRPDIIRTLKSLGPHAREMVPDLMELCDRQPDSLGMKALEAAWTIDGNRERTVQQLKAWLETHRNPELQELNFACLRFLWEIEPDVKLANEILKDWAGEDTTDHDRLAELIKMIRSIHPDETEFRSILHEILWNDPKHLIRLAIWDALKTEKSE